MKKNLTLDKVLLTSNDIATVDGGLIPDLLFLPFLFWKGLPGDIVPQSDNGDPDTANGDPDNPTPGEQT